MPGSGSTLSQAAVAQPRGFVGIQARSNAGLKAVRLLQPETYKDRLQRLWDRRGSEYDMLDTFHRPLAEGLVERARLSPGLSVLDVASGTGMVAIPAAQKVGHQGRVTAVDISRSMLGEVRCND